MQKNENREFQMANACASVSLTCVLTEMENAVSKSSSNAAGVYCGWWHFITIYFCEYWNCDNSAELMLTSFFSALIWRQQETKIHNKIIKSASWAPTVIFHAWIDSRVKTFFLSLFVCFLFVLSHWSILNFCFQPKTENITTHTHTQISSIQSNFDVCQSIWIVAKWVSCVICRL